MAYFCKPLSSSFFTNIHKQDQLLDIFEISKLLKNDLSIFIRDTLFLNPSLSSFDFRNKDLLSSFSSFFEANFSNHNYILKSEKTFNQANPLTKQELAIMSQSISDFYLNRIKQVTKKTSTNVYSLINISRYEENVIKKGKVIHKKNEIKKKEKIIKENSAIYKYLLHIDLRKIESREFKINKKDEKKKELYEKIENYLEKLYKNGKLMEKFLHVMKYKKINMFNKITVIEFISGSYQKMSISATHKGAEPTRHSYIEKDETNGKYKYFYKFKTGRKEILENGKKVDEIIRIPVNYNEMFHGEDLSKLNLDKPMYVKRRENGKIMFGALTKEDREFVYKKGDIYAGIDLNLRDNFMCITVKEKGIEGKLNKVIKNEEEFDDKLILKYKEIRNYQELNPEKYKKDLGKLCRIKEFQIKNIISETIKWLREKNVTNIVMEDLGFKNNKSGRKLTRVEEKITWMEKFYRMGSVKVWMREQCRKYGIVVHYTPSEFTSQECSSCHHIEKENRKGERFICKSCGLERNSDENASENIVNRVLIENVSLALHKMTELNGGVKELNSLHLGHEKTRQIVQEIFAQYADK